MPMEGGFADTAPEANRRRLVGRWVLVALSLGVALGVAVWAGSQRGAVSARSEAGRAGNFTVAWSTEAVTLANDGRIVLVEAVLSDPAAEPLTIEYEARGGSGVVFGAESITIPAGEDRGVLELQAANAPGQVIVDLTGGPGVTVVRPRRLMITVEAAPPAAAPAATTTSSAPDARRAGEPVVSVLAGGSLSDTDAADGVQAETQPDTVLLMAVASATSTSGTPVPEVLSDDVEWELVHSSMREGGARRLSIFRAVTGGGEVATMLNFSGSQRVINWIVVQVEGSDVADNGAEAVRQIATDSADGFERSADVELEPLAGGSTALGFFFMGANEAEGGQGFETLATVGPRKRLLMAIVGTDRLVATAEWPNGAHWKAIALELVAGP